MLTRSRVEFRQITKASSQERRALRSGILLGSSRGRSVDLMPHALFKPSPGSWRRLGWAAISVIVALGLSLLLKLGFNTPAWFFFLVSCVGSAWIGGQLTGWIAAVISILACDFFFVRPFYSLTVATEQIPYLLAFAASMIAGNWFGTWRRNEDRSRVKERNALKVQVETESARLKHVEAALRSEVNHREKAELESRIHYLRWRAVFENASLGIVLLNEVGVVIASNPRYQSTTQATSESLLGRKFIDCIAAIDRPRMEQELEEMLAGRHQGSQLELRHRRENGAQVWLRTHMTPVAANADFNRFLIALCEDLTEQKHAEDALFSARSELAHASRLTLLGELTASIAHEVNQPLSAVVNNSNACLRWLAMSPVNLEEARSAASGIVRDATRAADVIARVRGLMRKSEPTWDLLDVNALVRESLDMLKTELSQVGAEVRLNLDAALPMICGDRVELQQVVLNLAINAAEALAGISDRKGLITITSSKQFADEAGIVLEVIDSGSGMTQSDMNQLFTPFFTTKPKGTGIGLWICRSIVERHAGQLLAYANSSFGMTFRLLLPCKQPPQFSDAQVLGDDLPIAVLAAHVDDVPEPRRSV